MIDPATPDQGHELHDRAIAAIEDSRAIVAIYLETAAQANDYLLALRKRLSDDRPRGYWQEPRTN
jgi:hypothetical protein